MAEFSGSMVTHLGVKYLAKVISGEIDFCVSKVKIGSGNANIEIAKMEDISNYVLDGEIIGVNAKEEYADIKIKFSNAKVTEYFEFREIGIFVDDPDLGEVMYAYSNSGGAFDYIPKFTGNNLIEEEFTFQIYISNVSEINANIIKSLHAIEVIFDNNENDFESDNIQDAIEEIANKHETGIEIEHNLNCFPLVSVMETKNGFGSGGFGDIPFGGDPSVEVKCKITWINKYKITLALSKKISKSAFLEKINQYQYMINDEDVGLLINLYK